MLQRLAYALVQFVVCCRRAAGTGCGHRPIMPGPRLGWQTSPVGAGVGNAG